MFGGQAVAEALFGILNPSGKLPISFPRHAGQLPVYYNYLPGWHGGKYCDLPAAPLFAFGEGIGYSRFAYDGLAFDPDTLTVSMDVSNIGERTGTEIVQVYLRDEVSSVLTPVKRLAGFRRVSVEAGQTERVRIRLERESFMLVAKDGKPVLEPGTFLLMAGGSSRDQDLVSIRIRME